MDRSISAPTKLRLESIMNWSLQGTHTWGEHVNVILKGCCQDSNRGSSKDNETSTTLQSLAYWHSVDYLATFFCFWIDHIETLMSETLTSLQVQYITLM